jgi:small subunit ribosomal protein S1
MTNLLDEQTELTFAELLEAYEPQPVQVGEYRLGEILRIDEEYAIIDIGAKQEAVVPIEELAQLRENYAETLKVGDHVPVYVDRLPTLGDRLIVSVQKGLEQADWDKAAELLESQEILELEVTGYNKGGLLVQFHRLIGFIPNSHIPDLRRNQEDQSIKARMVGQMTPVQVLQVEPERKRLVFSGRAAARVRHAECLESLQVGQVVEGIVKNLVPFGAFVDVGGADGLIHISEVDWPHIDHPQEILKTGDRVQVLVKEVNRERERISLSRKALLPSPWQQFANEHKVDELIEGVVTNVQDYGAFIQLGDNIAGLLHVSEVDTASGGAPNELFRPGDKILARIVEINPDEERIRLSTRRVTYEEMANWAAQDWNQVPPTPEQAEPAEEEPAAADVASDGLENLPAESQPEPA